MSSLSAFLHTNVVETPTLLDTIQTRHEDRYREHPHPKIRRDTSGMDETILARRRHAGHPGECGSGTVNVG